MAFEQMIEAQNTFAKQNLYIACLNVLLKQVRDKSLAKIKSPLDKIIESKRQDNNKIQQ